MEARVAAEQALAAKLSETESAVAELQGLAFRTEKLEAGVAQLRVKESRHAQALDKRLQQPLEELSACADAIGLLETKVNALETRGSAVAQKAARWIAQEVFSRPFIFFFFPECRASPPRVP